MIKKVPSLLIMSVMLLLCSIMASCKREKYSYETERLKLDQLLATVNGESQIPDFSYAGFERNEKAIPDVPVKVTVEPGEGDDGLRIQNAITKVSAMPLVNGYRGAVLLKAGTYEVENSISITQSGVVLRGEGQSDNGTVIIATKQELRAANFTLLYVSGSGADYKEIGSPLPIDKDTIAVGTKKIPVTSSSGYKAGDSIALVRTPNQAWIDALDMAQYGWVPATYRIKHFRIIEKVESKAIWVDMPIVDAVYKKFGGGYISKVETSGRISHCGVENIRFKSAYTSDVDEDHAWTAISFNRTCNSWVKNVTSQYFGLSCVALSNQSDFNTIQDCAMLDPKSQPLGERRYAFYIIGGIGNLFQRCYSSQGRHDFVTSSRVTGPNVFLDCLAVGTLGDIGPHHRWATGILFDNISGDILRAVNAKGAGTGHGWTGAQIMYWNCLASYEFSIDSPPGGINWGIGCKGGQINGMGEYVSSGISVTPRSIFLSQLEKRLGSDAVIRVTSAAQRDGSIISFLGTWAGN